MQQQTIFVSTQQQAERPSSMRSSILATGLVILGLLSLVAAGSRAISLASGGAGTPASVGLNLVLGLLILASSRAVVRGSFVSLWLFSGAIVLEVLNSSLTRQSLSYIWIAAALWFLWQMLDLWKEGRLK